MTADMELSKPSDLLASLVSQDTAFLALPLFSIEEEDRRRKQSLTYETDVTLNDLPGKFKWLVSADPSYGFPDAFDRKVFKIMEALILENERPIKNPVFFHCTVFFKYLVYRPSVYISPGFDPPFSVLQR